MSSGSGGLYLSTLSDMSPASPATSDCLVLCFSGFFSFLFQSSRVCLLTFLGHLIFFLFFPLCLPFWGSYPVTTEGVRVSWTSTDVRRY